MCVFVSCAGIREQTEIKQSVSKLTEEVSAVQRPNYYLREGGGG